MPLTRESSSRDKQVYSTLLLSTHLILDEHPDGFMVTFLYLGDLKIQEVGVFPITKPLGAVLKKQDDIAQLLPDWDDETTVDEIKEWGNMIYQLAWVKGRTIIAFRPSGQDDGPFFYGHMVLGNGQCIPPPIISPVLMAADSLEKTIENLRMWL